MLYVVTSSPTRVAPAGPRGDGICRFEVATGREMGRIESVGGDVLRGTVLTPDCKLAAGVVGSRVALFDPIHGQEVRVLQGNIQADRSTHVLFSPDGKRLIAHEENPTRLVIWEVASGKVLQLHGNPVREAKATKGGFIGTTAAPRLSLSPDGKWLVDASKSVLRVIDLATGKERATPPSLTAVPKNLRFDPDGKNVIVTLNTSITHWEASTGKLMRREDGGKKAADPPQELPLPLGKTPVRTLQSADGRFTLTVQRDRTVTLTDQEKQQEHKIELPATTKKTITALTAPTLAFSPDGRQAAVCDGPSGMVFLVDTHQGKIKHTLSITPVKNTKAARTSRSGVVFFSGDGKMVGACGDRTLVLWETASGNEKSRLPMAVGVSLRGEVVPAPDGKILAVEVATGTIALVDVNTGKELGRLTIPVSDAQPGTASLTWASRTTGPSMLIFSPDSKYLARGLANGAVRLWDVQRLQVIVDLVGHSGQVEVLAFSPDGTRLASGGVDTTVLIWDVPAAVRKK